MNDEKQLETMMILQEECAEVIQIISKIYRFGFDSRWPDETSPNNREKMTEEIGDLLAMVDILVENCIISDTELNKARKNKKQKLKKWSRIYEST